ncbi:MAG: ATP synthase F1 subunit delta [Acidimicrobiia bacterium]|nr:ATP synthase F1 subunit delta [Acidimicrobiia bacterium]
MSNRTAAARYARALLDVALQEQTDLAQIESQLAAIVYLFASHDAAKKVLLNPAVPATRKGAAVAAIANQAGMSPIVGKLLVMLAERDRLVLLPDLLASFRDLVMAHQKVVRAEVTSAMELGADRIDVIQRRLAEVTGRTVLLTAKVDPALVGGMVARLGGTVYDGSVTTQLKKIRTRLAEGL